MNWSEWLAGFAGASPVEWLATVCGFICVYLLIKRNIWCFLFGLIQVSLYSWIFYGVKLYSDMLLHLVYVGFQIYGYLIWSRNLDQGGQVIVDKGKAKHYAFFIVLALFSTGVLGWLMNTYTDASLAYFDAFTTCTSLVAQWLLSHKKLFNWSFWIVVDIVAIWIYWQKGLYPTSALYLCFLVMACIGQWQWYNSYQKTAGKAALD
ncbi:nicotinamide riboside transporter PnuC [Aliiglaciecola sp. LCG003]|uniref:nicotinamide riboside transporter PnuC n=1 Tax=Aliiglaciecola sp. LCG003 TaxID=3053655 RepID=UPI002572718F|nr:nicotinamide riboside transporter PnuC [Aliiglaciecola sp. LCG003]WJG08685.1 nicotinamide riboside transporter PnuC [Aliiglaciecola sp. LCG003]